MLEEVRGKRMSKGVRGNRFVELREANGLFDGALQDAFVEVVAHDFPGLRIDRTLSGGEDVLPGRLAIGIGIFTFEGIGEVNFAITFPEIPLVTDFHPLNLHAEVEEDAVGERDGAILLAFRVANDDLMTGKINVLDAQAQAFHQPESGAEEPGTPELARAV